MAYLYSVQLSVKDQDGLVRDIDTAAIYSTYDKAMDAITTFASTVFKTQMECQGLGIPSPLTLSEGSQPSKGIYFIFNNEEGLTYGIKIIKRPLDPDKPFNPFNSQKEEKV